MPLGEDWPALIFIGMLILPPLYALSFALIPEVIEYFKLRKIKGGTLSKW